MSLTNQSLHSAGKEVGTTWARHPQTALITVRLASTANVASLSAVSITMDVATIAEGDLIWLKDQTTGAENGLYVASDIGAATCVLSRTDPFTAGETIYPGQKVYVAAGSANGGKTFDCTNTTPGTVGTTALTFAQSAAASASAVPITDAGGFTAQTTVEGALQEIYQDLKTSQGLISLMPHNFYLATGAPLAVFADGASAVPGSSLTDSEAFCVRWNNHAAPDAILTSFAIPPDMDITANAVMHIRASKTGATVGDAVTFLVAAFNQVDAALHDADADFGGTSSAMVGNAVAKTVQNVTLTLALANLAAYPASVTMTIKPTDGTLGTDDLCLLEVYVLYKRKLLTS